MLSLYLAHARYSIRRSDTAVWKKIVVVSNLGCWKPPRACARAHRFLLQPYMILRTDWTVCLLLIIQAVKRTQSRQTGKLTKLWRRTISNRMVVVYCIVCAVNLFHVTLYNRRSFIFIVIRSRPYKWLQPRILFCFCSGCVSRLTVCNCSDHLPSAGWDGLQVLSTDRPESNGATRLHALVWRNYGARQGNGNNTWCTFGRVYIKITRSHHASGSETEKTKLTQIRCTFVLSRQKRTYFFLADGGLKFIEWRRRTFP